MRTHPHLYEINTWPWLDELARRSGRHETLASVPDVEWDRLRKLGIDIVYLMGIWKRSALGCELAKTDAGLAPVFDRALPGWTAADVPGSAYCISDYAPDPRIGTWAELADVRAKLHARGMLLLVDFVPNHTGFDHPWVKAHPDRYVQGDESAFRRRPDAFRAIEITTGDVRFIARGRDPFFAPWPDVAQLDYSNADTRTAMTEVLRLLAMHADGVRCDMAMLVLSDVFGRTWNGLLRCPMQTREFWAEARAAVPEFTMLAEVYWDLEWQLQQLGFDFTYDKRLYDRLLHSSAADVRGHLLADADYQRRSARFIENHDEPRSASEFGDRVRAAAVVMSTLPGLRFFHQGQFDGRMTHLPVHLGRWIDEPANQDLRRFYDRLLGAADDDLFHSGEWRLLDVHPAGDGSYADLVAWCWTSATEIQIVAVNLGGGSAQGLVQVSPDLPHDSNDAAILFEDQLDGQRYPWSRAAIDRNGR
jgi:glycosidase